jgi:CheY-like chemotaxis protein
VQSTVLVCEDEYFIRSDMCEHLRDHGYRVLEAVDAAQAQKLFCGGEHIYLLSTDVVMPGDMDGIGLANWVRHKFPDVRIMVVTGWPKHQNAGRNFDSFMMKPYRMDDYVRRVEALVPPTH